MHHNGLAARKARIAINKLAARLATKKDGRYAWANNEISDCDASIVALKTFVQD
jgi:hypothetical protein